MKKKELTNLLTKDVEYLTDLVAKKRIEFIKIKAEMKVSKEKNLKKTKNLRRDLAQVLTILKEKEIFQKEKSNTEKEDTKSISKQL